MASGDLLTDLLRDVSRSFYLTLRVLPGGVRRQIGLAYLLARATDTIADTHLVGVKRRLEALEALRARILGESSARLEFGDFLASPSPSGGVAGSPAERILLERIEAALTTMNSFTPEDQTRIREVLSIITSGQILDLQRFGQAPSRGIGALRTKAELDDYTYRVAGCVGEFWTKMCRRHLFPHARLNDATLIAQGIRFGCGLQLVNILRDVPADLRAGRCYLPIELLARAQLQPEQLLDPRSIGPFRPIYNELLEEAASHLAAGWEYTNTLPRSSIRVRLACAWPILIGIRTLDRLRTGNVLDPALRIKVSRDEVKRIIWSTVWHYPNRRAWAALGTVTSDK